MWASLVGPQPKLRVPFPHAGFASLRDHINSTTLNIENKMGEADGRNYGGKKE